MWQVVDPNVPAQLQTAVAVLAAHDSSWVSAAYLKKWMQGRHAQLFYFSDVAYELVVGFGYVSGINEWRVMAGGGRGSLGMPALQQMVQQIVTFMQTNSLKQMVMFNDKRPPTDPGRALVDNAIAVARQRPDVAMVRGTPDALGERYELVLQ